MSPIKPRPFCASGWVSVEERLPDLDKPVLVYAGGAEMVCERRDPGDGEGWFWALRTSPSGFASPGGVTHWQPLPAPPARPSGATEGGDDAG